MRNFFLVLCLLSFPRLYAQNIFSQAQMEYRKPFAPYSIQNVIGLEDQESIVLLEEGKGKFRLIRYDKYFFDKWTVEIDFKKEGSFPKLLRFDNEVMVFRCWTTKDEAIAEQFSYDIRSGDATNNVRKTLADAYPSAANAAFQLASDQNGLLVYNITSEDSEVIQLYDLKTLELKRSVEIALQQALSKTKAVFADSSNNIFVALADPGSFTLDAYYFDNTAEEPVFLSSAFTFQRPADVIPSIHIVKQSKSSYFVATPAHIGEELTGLNITSLNVVLKTLHYSNTYNFDSEFIKGAYANSHFTSENQRKKYVTTPDNLAGFKAREAIPDSEGGITLIFENLEMANTNPTFAMQLNQPLKWKLPEDVLYFGEDLMLVSFTASGDVSWKKVIQKTQIGDENALGLSYFSEAFGVDIKLVMQESAKGNSVFVYTIDLRNGGVTDVKKFFDKKVEINKNYSGWIDENTLLVCTHPIGSKKRTLFLVEF